MKQVLSGFDLLCHQDFAILKGKRVGILANHAAVNSRFQHLACLVANADQVTLVRLFSPEHGFRGELQDMEDVANYRDPYTGLPVVSLYGRNEASLRPLPEHLSDLDAVVVDLPDIGSRYYTFAQSLGYMMQESARLNVEIIVLDRPNPINGLSIAGAPLTSECTSFCGYAPVPNRHGLTLGELAQLMNHGFESNGNRIPAINCNLQIIKASGWSRYCYLDQTSLPWITPSPNMPTLDTAIVYPGACLLEGTNISEGRGTTKPFEIFGAPYINGKQLAAELASNKYDLHGATLRPLFFRPKFSKWADNLCGGVQLHIIDRKEFEPVRWYLAMIHLIAQLYPQQFAWRKETYEFKNSIPAVDLLFGSDQFRLSVDGQVPLCQVFATLDKFEHEFSQTRDQFLLYH